MYVSGTRIRDLFFPVVSVLNQNRVFTTPSTSSATTQKQQQQHQQQEDMEEQY
jgi:hypothetical protein